MKPQKNTKAKTSQPDPIRVTIAGVRIEYEHLREPDTEGQYADGKFKATVAFSKQQIDDMPDVIAACDQLSQEAFGRVGIRPWRDGDTDLTHTNNIGEYVFAAKSQYRPDIADADGNLYDGDVPKGSIVDLDVALVTHSAGGRAGIACRLYGVRVVEAAKGASGGGSVFLNPAARAQAAASRAKPTVAPSTNASAQADDDGASDGRDTPHAILERIKLKRASA